ncbi:MAG: hypothetical protein WKF49_03775 [Thermoleophilaceae bacterium]
MTRFDDPDGPGRDELADDQHGRRDLLDDDPRLQAGLDHLQGAAREMIAATRALLDVAEDLVEDPRSVARLVGLLGSVGDLATRAARSTTWVRPRSSRDGDDDDDDPPVQRIPVS